MLVYVCVCVCVCVVSPYLRSLNTRINMHKYAVVSLSLSLARAPSTLNSDRGDEVAGCYRRLKSGLRWLLNVAKTVDKHGRR